MIIDLHRNAKEIKAGKIRQVLVPWFRIKPGRRISLRHKKIIGYIVPDSLYALWHKMPYCWRYAAEELPYYSLMRIVRGDGFETAEDFEAYYNRFGYRRFNLITWAYLNEP